MSHYKQKTGKPKFVEKGTVKYVQKGKYVEKTNDKPKEGHWVQKKTQTKYKEINNGGYDYDSSTITEDTVIPKLPKK